MVSESTIPNPGKVGVDRRGWGTSLVGSRVGGERVAEGEVILLRREVPIPGNVVRLWLPAMSCVQRNGVPEQKEGWSRISERLW